MTTPAFIRAPKRATPCPRDLVLTPYVLYRDGCRWPLEVNYPQATTDYDDRLLLAAQVAAESVEDRTAHPDNWAEWRVIAVDLSDPAQSHDVTDEAVAALVGQMKPRHEALNAPDWWAERNAALREWRGDDPDAEDCSPLAMEREHGTWGR
jgi:hypothetical protein